MKLFKYDVSSPEMAQQPPQGVPCVLPKAGISSSHHGSEWWWTFCVSITFNVHDALQFEQHFYATASQGTVLYLFEKYDHVFYVIINL